MHDSSEQNSSFSLTDSVNWLYFIVTAHATCLTVFLRHSFGSEGLGFPGVAALLFLVGSIVVTSDPTLIWLLVLWFAALVVQRIITISQQLRGLRQHSRYAGYPGVTRALFPAMTEELALQRMEPVVCGVIGLVLLAIVPTIGGFVLTGAVSLAVKTGIEHAAQRRTLQQWRDAEIEQQVLLEDWERFRHSSRGNNSWPM